MSFNCPGVDTDKFRATCRCPLFPGRWNRWILVRTTNDQPSEQDLLSSTARVFSNWFSPSGVSSAWGWLIDPLATYDIEEGPRAGTTTSRSGAADLIVVSRTANQSITWPATVATRLRCEPLPMIVPGGAVWIAVEFVYRGTAQDMDWPVHKPPSLIWPVDPWCPFDAEWMLDSVGYPPTEAAPPERTTTEKAGAAVAQAAGGAAGVVAPLAPALGVGGLVLAAGVTVGALLYFGVRR